MKCFACNTATVWVGDVGWIQKIAWQAARMLGDGIGHDDGVPFDCNYDAEATVQLEAFPCTVVTGEGGLMDVLQCQGEMSEGENTCNCVVSGGVCPSPSPTPSPTSSSSTCAIMFVVHVVTSAVGVLALVW